MKKKCEHCGAEYQAHRPTQKYCSDRCRTAAYRERLQGDRKKALRAYRIKEAQPSPGMRTEGIDIADLRAKLCRMRRKGIMTEEYWKLYQEVDLKYYGGRSVVNGIPTNTEYFAEAVLIRVQEDQRIQISTTGGQ